MNLKGLTCSLRRRLPKLIQRVEMTASGSAFGRNLNRISLPIGCDPVIVGVIDGGDLANVTRQNVQVIRICSRRLYYRVVTLVNQEDISVLHRVWPRQGPCPGINVLDGKSILPLKTVIVGFLVVRGIIPRIMPMRGKTLLLPLGVWIS